MDNKEFQKVVERRIGAIHRVLGAKADEYARGDRLSNFKQAAALTNEQPLEVLAGLMVKHEVALHNFVNDLGRDGKMQSWDRWDEKIGDIINYLILADALIQDWAAEMKDKTTCFRPADLTDEYKKAMQDSDPANCPVLHKDTIDKMEAMMGGER